MCQHIPSVCAMYDHIPSICVVYVRVAALHDLPELYLILPDGHFTVVEAQRGQELEMVPVAPSLHGRLRYDVPH